MAADGTARSGAHENIGMSIVRVTASPPSSSSIQITAVIAAV
jgi:hypothetical protein